MSDTLIIKEKIDMKEKVAVLIVGGGIVGLSAALLLLQHNVPFILVERHSSTSIHPRARGVNNRSMEIYRELGFEEEVRQAGADLAPAMGILQGKTLVAALANFHAPTSRTAFKGMVTNLGDLSPTAAARVTQDKLEPVLLKIARQRGGDLRFYTELISFEQNDQGITATIVDRASGVQSNIRADYMLAADGANSFIRRQVAAPTSGRGILGHQLNVLFKADLRELTHEREFSLCRIDNPAVCGLFTSIDFKDTWVFHISISYDPQKDKPFSPEHCKQLIRTALGIPDIEIEIKSVLPWESAMRVLDNLQHGRIFFAGDAAHQMPPWGGQGANSGIADVHNLAWKLAAVLKGQAGPTLLQTYNEERQPVGFLAAAESAAAADEHGSMAIQHNQPNWQERFPRILGYYKYQKSSRAIIREAIESPATDVVGLDGRPGMRVPHVWVEKQGQFISTLDTAVGQFALLTGSEGDAWCAAARAVAGRLPIKLIAYRVGPQGDLIDEKGQWQSRAGLTATGALLLRPDGYVAWRAPRLTTNPIQDLESACMQIIDRVPV